MVGDHPVELEWRRSPEYCLLDLPLPHQAPNLICRWRGRAPSGVLRYGFLQFVHVARWFSPWANGSGALAASYRAPGSLRDMRVTSAVVTLWARALVAPGGSLARHGSSHCPRRSLWLIAVATLCSSGISGSSSHVCGKSPVQMVPGGTWLAGVRSCTGHSANCLSSQSSGFEVSTFSPHSGSACHLIFNCRLPCWPGVASLPCILPRNHANCFGYPLSVAPYTLCTSAPSGHSGCMAARSAGVKNGHAHAFGFGCGSV